MLSFFTYFLRNINFENSHQLIYRQKNKRVVLSENMNTFFPPIKYLLEIRINHIKALTHMLLILCLSEMSVLISDALTKPRLYLQNPGDQRGFEQSMPVRIFSC